MENTLRSLMKQYGEDASVQIPNEVFGMLSNGIKNIGGKTNAQQVSFAYSYLVHVAMIYKYPYFLDFDNETYIQNGDIKEWLGYSRTTKTINRVIKKGGILDEIGLTSTTKDFPVYYLPTEDVINKIPVKEYYYISDSINLGDGLDIKTQAKYIIQNRNYEIKKPSFILDAFGDREYGTVYDYSKTHSITVKEMLYFFTHKEFNTIDFLIYCYVKSKAKGMPQNQKSMSLRHSTDEMGIDEKTLYAHLRALKDYGVINVQHKGWKASERHSEANTYQWIGVKDNSAVKTSGSV